MKDVLAVELADARRVCRSLVVASLVEDAAVGVFRVRAGRVRALVEGEAAFVVGVHGFGPARSGRGCSVMERMVA